MGSESALVAGGDAPGKNALPLVLPKLVVIVGNLDPVARRENVEVQKVVLRRLKIQAVEERFIVAPVVNGLEFGSVQETVAAGGIGGHKVAEPVAAPAQAQSRDASVESSVIGVDAAEGRSE